MATTAAVVNSKHYWCDIGAHVFPMEKYQRVVERQGMLDLERRERHPVLQQANAALFGCRKA